MHSASPTLPFPTSSISCFFRFLHIYHNSQHAVYAVAKQEVRDLDRHDSLHIILTTITGVRLQRTRRGRQSCYGGTGGYDSYLEPSTPILA
jgi:hypothetical protein